MKKYLKPQKCHNNEMTFFKIYLYARSGNIEDTFEGVCIKFGLCSRSSDFEDKFEGVAPNFDFVVEAMLLGTNLREFV